ncbi:GNAT family N-acetyltransferase [Mesobaculum littorinae]|uniref:GNAT family N-acetyltransferase n=1 Tax=Mesobaculum littorinae TaxID=2486419 RepID=A0A438AEU9_9RHOB|nr:GNAT family N-acetyltransferase [Mesobaculum littorinae]RVV97197.1 GNAT family N-acetyltransferase [Mesobaculum littorinae]
MTPTILQIDVPGLDDRADALADILSACVAQGAAIGFMLPLSDAAARGFWTDAVRPEIAAGRRVLFGVTRGGDFLGAVQLLTAMPANQPHRAEIAKMVVHPRARRQGLGRLLMGAALDHARAIGKTLVTLDTRTGDAAEALYAAVGFQRAGVIPDYAWDPDGAARHGTTFMFARL